MNINATIIAQAINLFLTFFIVRLLLIKPVMMALSADHAAINNLNNIIDSEQQKISEITIERENIWLDARSVFEQEQPQQNAISDIIFKDIAPSIDIPAFSAEEQKKFIDQSAQKVIARLEDDQI